MAARGQHEIFYARADHPIAAGQPAVREWKVMYKENNKLGNLPTRWGSYSWNCNGSKTQKMFERYICWWAVVRRDKYSEDWLLCLTVGTLFSAIGVLKIISNHNIECTCCWFLIRKIRCLILMTTRRRWLLKWSWFSTVFAGYCLVTFLTWQFMAYLTSRPAFELYALSVTFDPNPLL